MKKSLAVAIAVIAGFGVASVALAQAPQSQTRSTPKDWSYEIKDGKRVPKANRVTSADGSWREETRVGKCVTVKEKTSDGVYRESRSCDQ
jgi:hypothetical protein